MLSSRYRVAVVQQARRVARLEDVDRVRIEREHGVAPVKGLMVPEVHPVERADRDLGRTRPGRAASAAPCPLRRVGQLRAHHLDSVEYGDRSGVERDRAVTGV